MPKMEEQRPTRVQTSIFALLVDSDGGELPVHIVDISSGGFRLRTSERLLEAEEIKLRVSRYGDFRAVIQWVEGFEAGGRFLDPISL